MTVKYHRYKDSLPVAVLASFIPDKTPMPHKVKYKDQSGNEQSFIIDKIGRVLDGGQEIIYQCFSYFGEYERTYALIFWKKDLKWTLSDKPCFMWENQ